MNAWPQGSGALRVLDVGLQGRRDVASCHSFGRDVAELSLIPILTCRLPVFGTAMGTGI